MNFNVTSTDLEHVLLIERKKFNDDRGYFVEFFRNDFFQKEFKGKEFVQDNLSFSRKGVIRGLHFQKEPFSQGKLVSVIKGRIMDVAVNMERNSNQFGKYVMVELSEENSNSLFIPSTFAHGFVALDDSYVLYKTTNFYNKDSECGVRFDDPDIDVKWSVSDPIVSMKDRELLSLKEIVEKGDTF
ncbi:MAG: dTDP-4-dehydrorhamnose 3,5-epimerase [Candidatus Thermoplasmatota archaeon]|nr:dTDP-4-dehydrorhamnose 3,5-epimerase [Candidatus Thermoplasmatota archaeon]